MQSPHDIIKEQAKALTHRQFAYAALGIVFALAGLGGSVALFLAPWPEVNGWGLATGMTLSTAVGFGVLSYSFNQVYVQGEALLLQANRGLVDTWAREHTRLTMETIEANNRAVDAETELRRINADVAKEVHQQTQKAWEKVKADERVLELRVRKFLKDFFKTERKHLMKDHSEFRNEQLLVLPTTFSRWQHEMQKFDMSQFQYTKEDLLELAALLPSSEEVGRK